MPSERVIVISDVHLDQWQDDLPDEYEAKRQTFLDFLDWVAQMGSDGKVGRFVIVGDLINVPQKDRAPLLPTYDEVYAGLNGIIAAGVKFGYAIGNHDAGLVGLSLDLQQPEICVGYPYLLVNSGGSQFAVEHGHLYDPWLWDYVRQLGAAMWTSSAGPHGAPVLKMVGAAPVQTPSGAALDSAFEVGELWQTSLRDADPSDTALAGLRDVLLKDLEDDYSDVTDCEADGQMLADRDALRAQLEGSPSDIAGGLSLAPSLAGARPLALSIEGLVAACYSGPHWRRAARHRLPELIQEVGAPLAGIIMGHTHYADQFTWLDDAGQTQWYVNSGSWRRESADLVIVEGGAAQGLKRNWKDALPLL